MKRKDKALPGIYVDVIAISAYFLVFIYVLVFRIHFNIVGSGESEFFPIEVLTTASIISALFFIYVIYKSDSLDIGRGNLLYPCLIATFFSYYLAENNWLLGREQLMGALVFAAMAGLVFLITLKIIYRVNFKASVIFGLGILSLAFGTIVDASVYGIIPYSLGISRTGLVEEVLELYSSLFFLHSLVLLYFYSNSQTHLIEKNKRDLAKILLGSMFLSFGNSHLLYNRGETVPLQRTFTGLLIIGFTLSMFYISFIKKKSLENSTGSAGKNCVLPR